MKQVSPHRLPGYNFGVAAERKRSRKTIQQVRGETIRIRESKNDLQVEYSRLKELYGNQQFLIAIYKKAYDEEVAKRVELEQYYEKNVVNHVVRR